MANPLWNEHTLIGKVVAVLAIGFLVIVGLMVENNVERGRGTAKKLFLKDQFNAIAIYENNLESDQALTKAYLPLIDRAKPWSSFQEEGGNRDIYRLPDNPPIIRGLPVPAFVQSAPPAGISQTPHWSIIYAVFKEPKASDKLRNWAKENRYSGWDFQVQWDRPDNFNSKEVRLERKGSHALFMAFFRKKLDSFLWDGTRILDLKPGVTSNVPGKKESEHYDRYITWLESIAK